MPVGAFHGRSNAGNSAGSGAPYYGGGGGGGAAAWGNRGTGKSPAAGEQAILHALPGGRSTTKTGNLRIAVDAGGGNQAGSGLYDDYGPGDEDTYGGEGAKASPGPPAQVSLPTCDDCPHTLARVKPTHRSLPL